MLTFQGHPEASPGPHDAGCLFDDFVALMRNAQKEATLTAFCFWAPGPIVIGQACEFDYSGTQASRALREEGVRTVLLNSNPATIMTDPDMADAVLH